MIRFAPLITIYNLEAASDVVNEVIWSFSSSLKGISSVRQRFNIHIVDNISSERHFLEGSIKSVWKYFPVGLILDKSKEEQKGILLDLIVDSFLSVSKFLDWDSKLIMSAKKQALGNKLQFHHESKPIYYKTKDIKASIELELTENKVSMWVVFYRKNIDKPLRIHLLDTHESEISFFGKFKSPLWINSNQFGFKLDDGVSLSIDYKSKKIVWTGTDSKIGELLMKQVNYDYKLTSEEYARLANW